MRYFLDSSGCNAGAWGKVELAPDVLTIGDGETVWFGENAVLKVYGGLCLTPATGATLELRKSASKFTPIEIAGDAGYMKLERMEVNGLSFLMKTPVCVEVRDCEFKETRFKSTLTWEVSSGANVIEGCVFTDTERPAIQNRSRVNMLTGEKIVTYNGMNIRGNVFTNCNTSLFSNFCMVDVATGGVWDVEISRNTFNGKMDEAGAGGIYVHHIVVDHPEQGHKVRVTGNKVTGGNAGILIDGPMDAVIENNVCVDNRWAKAMVWGFVSGLRGMGIGVRNESSKRMSDVQIMGNRISGVLKGLVISGGVRANAGKTGDPSAPDYNPGRNVFENNGCLIETMESQWSTAGEKYDPAGHPIDIDAQFYSYSPLYAQGNRWGNLTDEAEILKGVYGDVVVTPFETGTPGLEAITEKPEGRDSLMAQNATVFVNPFGDASMATSNRDYIQELVFSEEGNDVYLYNPVSSSMLRLNSWIKGSCVGEDTWEFTFPQYLGKVSNMFTGTCTEHYMYVMEREDTGNDDDVAYAIAPVQTFRIVRDGEGVMRPENPALMLGTADSFGKGVKWTGWGICGMAYEGVLELTQFTCVIPCRDASDKKVLHKGNLSFRVYVNGGEEPIVFSPEKYQGLEGELVEIPFGFNSGTFDFMYSYGTKNLFFVREPEDELEKVGVQSVYRVGGDVKTSPIAYVQLKEPSGVVRPEGDAPVVSEEWFGLDGLPTAAGGRGVKLKRSVYSDGTVRMEKVVF